MEERNLRKVMIGTVISNKMDKTVVVAVATNQKHKNYGKVQRKTYKLKAHDEKNECQENENIENIQVNDNQENITSLCNIAPTWGELIKKTFNNFINCISKLFSSNKENVKNND